MARCDCCDLPVAMCGKTAEQRQHAEVAAERRALAAAGWIEARYPGVCATCGTGYGPGTMIRHADGDRTRTSWVADCCAQPEVVPT